MQAKDGHLTKVRHGRLRPRRGLRIGGDGDLLGRGRPVIQRRGVETAVVLRQTLRGVPGRDDKRVPPLGHVCSSP
ncbi:hypothetical protein ACFFX0_32625 [Citricoccus parietis]|uniref:Uncharacterized protein n=1 Tax=Citricoccus parietis TaxID=592307 RepID=A0ABV5G9M2_9MICC